MARLLRAASFGSKLERRLDRGRGFWKTSSYPRQIPSSITMVTWKSSRQDFKQLEVPPLLCRFGGSFLNHGFETKPFGAAF